MLNTVQERREYIFNSHGYELQLLLAELIDLLVVMHKQFIYYFIHDLLYYRLSPASRDVSIELPGGYSGVSTRGIGISNIWIRYRTQGSCRWCRRRTAR